MQVVELHYSHLCWTITASEVWWFPLGWASPVTIQAEDDRARSWQWEEWIYQSLGKIKRGWDGPLMRAHGTRWAAKWSNLCAISLPDLNTHTCTHTFAPSYSHCTAPSEDKCWDGAEGLPSLVPHMFLAALLPHLGKLSFGVARFVILHEKALNVIICPGLCDH